MSVITYERRHREDILNLMYCSRRHHSHLDWYKVANWLDTSHSLMRLHYEEEQLLAFLGASVPLHGASWLRVLAVDDNYEVLPSLRPLWHEIEGALLAADIRLAAILVMNRWLEQFLTDFGFVHSEEVITLHRSASQRNEAIPLPPGLKIRLAYQEDLAHILRVDHAAFVAPWQMHHDELRHALRQAASATVAEYNGEVIGYQISTRNQGSGHLARLAVVRQHQGQRIGAHLLDDLITRFNRRAVRSITVNTQQSNIASQRLYERYGFHRNGFDIPVWIKSYAPSP